MKNFFGVGASLLGAVCVIASGALLYDVAFENSELIDSAREAMGYPPMPVADMRIREAIAAGAFGFSGGIFSILGRRLLR
jgi:hypothetical protein